MSSWMRKWGIMLTVAIVAGCGAKPAPPPPVEEKPPARTTGNESTTSALKPTLPSLPDLTKMEPAVANLLRELHQTAVSQPESAKAWGRLGMGLDVHGEYSAAIPCYRRAEALDPRDFRWSYFLAWVMSLADVEPATTLAQYQLAIAKNPGYATAHARLGALLSGNGQFQAAVNALRKALALDPTLIQVHRDLGQALLALGNAEAAVTHLEVAQREMPDDAPTLAALAQAYRRLGRVDEARAVQVSVRAEAPRDVLPDSARAEVTAMGVSSFVRIFRAQE
ncbi:MAG: tetratricopeptide repeat protein, partial [Phycisphaerae bacterium]